MSAAPEELRAAKAADQLRLRVRHARDNGAWSSDDDLGGPLAVYRLALADAKEKVAWMDHRSFFGGKAQAVRVDDIEALDAIAAAAAAEKP